LHNWFFASLVVWDLDDSYKENIYIWIFKDIAGSSNDKNISI
jgi:hypothetical protein